MAGGVGGQAAKLARPRVGSVLLVFLFVLVFVLVVLFLVLLVPQVVELFLGDVVVGLFVGLGVFVLVPVVVLDVTVLVFVGGQDAVPVGHLDGVVADQAHAVVVAEVLELVEFAVDLAAFAALDDLAHGCRG